MSTTDETPAEISPFAKSLVTIHFSTPGFTIPQPDDVQKRINPTNTVFNWGGVKIAQRSPQIAVKFGSHVTFSEAKSMIFVNENTTTFPVPKTFAYYTYGPIDRDIDDYGGLFDPYIFMSFVEGQTLDKVWDTYDADTKARIANIANQLKTYFDELQWIRAPGYIGSVEFGPAIDPILEYYRPFDSDEVFNTTLISAYQSKAPK